MTQNISLFLFTSAALRSRLKSTCNAIYLNKFWQVQFTLKYRKIVRDSRYGRFSSPSVMKKFLLDASPSPLRFIQLCAWPWHNGIENRKVNCDSWLEAIVPKSNDRWCSSKYAQRFLAYSEENSDYKGLTDPSGHKMNHNSSTYERKVEAGSRQ